MAYGDVGGTNPTLVVTCKARSEIAKDDTLRLAGNYAVTNLLFDGNEVFGVALDGARNGSAVPVCLRGVVQVGYTGARPVVGDFAVCSSVRGRVRAGRWGKTGALVLKANTERQTVDVLL